MNEKLFFSVKIEDNLGFFINEIPPPTQIVLFPPPVGENSDWKQYAYIQIQEENENLKNRLNVSSETNLSRQLSFASDSVKRSPLEHRKTISPSSSSTLPKSQPFSSAPPPPPSAPPPPPSVPPCTLR